MQPPEPALPLEERARRLGPLPYSARGPNPPPELPPAADLVAWLVDAVDRWWVELGRPDPITMVEVGAGDGRRAAAFLGAGPECLTALRYVLVEEDAHLRHQHATHLPIESPVFVLGPVEAAGEDDELIGPVAGIGPLVTSLAEPPEAGGAAVVAVIGWLSRLPSDRLEWRDGAWSEVRLAASHQPGSGLTELLVPLDPERAEAANALTRETALTVRSDGARIALLGPAVEWVASTLRVAEAGRLAVIDRWSPVTSATARRGGPAPGPRPARRRAPARGAGAGGPFPRMGRRDVAIRLTPWTTGTGARGGWAPGRRWCSISTGC